MKLAMLMRIRMAHFILHQHRHPERHTEPDNVPLMGFITAGQQNAVHGLVIKETGRKKIKLETKQMNPEKRHKMCLAAMN